MLEGGARKQAHKPKQTTRANPTPQIFIGHCIREHMCLMPSEAALQIPAKQFTDLCQIQWVGVAVKPDFDQSCRERSKQPLVVECDIAQMDLGEQLSVVFQNVGQIECRIPALVCGR